VRIELLLVVVIAMVAAGCGGGSGKTTTRSETRTSERPPSKADYVAVADTICKNHQSRQEDLESQARELGRISSAEKTHRIAELLRQESDNRVAEAQELDGLRPPAADAATTASILSLLRAQARVIDDWAKAYDDLDSEAIRRLQIRLGALAAEAGERARSYGFEVCGQQ
jgi:hypothetical protein